MTALGIEGYRDYLVRRDGDADLLHRHLATREEFFGGLVADPVRSRRPIDRDVFARNLHRRRPESGLSREMLFLLATAKLNQAERFGVGLGETYGHNSGDDAPTERVYIELEELYHTRLLAYVLDIFGLPFQVMPPPFVMRQFVKVNVFLTDLSHFAKLNEVMATYFKEPYPARAALGVASLPRGARVEVECILSLA